MKDIPGDSTTNHRHRSIVNELPGAETGQKDQLHGKTHQDAFWSKEAKTISELPKILSIFYNADGKLKRISYILNFRDQKSLDVVVDEIKRLFEIKRHDSNDISSEEKWKLYNLNGQLVKNTRDLYFQIASSFLLCKTSVIKLPPVSQKGHETNSSVAQQSLKDGKDGEMHKIPFVHQSRPSSGNDFLQRNGRTFKPHVSKQEMGWIFGSSHLKRDDPNAPPKRNRQARSTSPNSRVKKTKPPAVPHKTKLDNNTNHSSRDYIKEQIEKAKAKDATVKKVDAIKESGIKLTKRSRSVDETAKIPTQLTSSAAAKIKKDNGTKVSDKKKNVSKSAEVKTEKKKKKRETGEIKVETVNDVADGEVNKKDEEELVKLSSEVAEPKTVEETVENAQPKQQEREKSVILVKSNTLTEDRSLFVDPFVTDMFGVNIPNPMAVRRGSIPLTSWMIPVNDDGPKTSLETQRNSSTQVKSLKKSHSVKSHSFDREETQPTSTIVSAVSQKEKSEVSVISEVGDHTAATSINNRSENSTVTPFDSLKTILPPQQSPLTTSNNAESIDIMSAKAKKESTQISKLKHPSVANKSAELEKSTTEIETINLAKEFVNKKQHSNLSKRETTKNSIHTDDTVEEKIFGHEKTLSTEFDGGHDENGHNHEAEVEEVQRNSSSAISEIKLSNSFPKEKSSVTKNEHSPTKVGGHKPNFLDELFPKSADKQLFQNSDEHE